MDSIISGSKEPKIDLRGYSFGEFKVLEEGEPKIRNDGHKVRQWKCLCSCGNIRYLSTQEIKTKKRKSCGCKHNEYRRKNATIHGDSHKRLHNIWSGMRTRCYCETEYHYKWYGARGIKMDDKWRNDYCAFKKWALNAGYSPELSIDRIDNDGDYTPDNCRWVDHKTQCNNTRRNHYIEAFGEKLTMSQWADKTGIPYATIKRRIKRGWKPECAVTKPIRKLKNRTADTVATTHIQDRYDAYNELFYKRRKPE